MNRFSADGALPPKTTSASTFDWPGSRSATSPLPVALLLLLAAGIAAALLREAFRLPLRMPGHHGIEWLAILVLARLTSARPVAGMVTGIGAALTTICVGSGHGQMALALTLLLQGCLADALLFRPRLRIVFFAWIPIAGALIHMTAPLLRNTWMSLVAGTLPFHSLVNGLAYPLATHALFGAAGATIGLLVFLSRKPGRH
ncbi:hypothetical protein GCM10011430_06290 [Oxalicibacterium solurbis]|uniref:Uncharacterized protein n=1 Tax=Oxalicibacterium solurbis TaxID=69280 RepID=A0A8J3AUI5_9BURK|nr:hypothetical protein GCM10011430_06290 [Oxalicibacterium solurbis]